MRKIMITGSSGFVASHFIEYIAGNHPEYEIVGCSIDEPSYNFDFLNDKLKMRFYSVNLMDLEHFRNILSEEIPDYLLHLAAFSSVAYSWKHPTESFTNNCNIFLNVVDAVQAVCPRCRVLSVGSSEEYGNVLHENLPIRENQRTNPLSPYAVARVSQELLSKVFVDSFGMQIIMTRSFNHIGPRQDQRFVVPSFINRILDIRDKGLNTGKIETGNLEIIRDFVDVRDVVEAYFLLLTKGISGQIYNICSGKGIKLGDIIALISEYVGVEVKTEVNPDFVRPNDNMEIVGSAYKIETELGWKPRIELKKTIKDMINYYEEQRKR